MYAAAFLPSFLPRFEQLGRRVAPFLHVMAWINVPLGIGVAVYTGILLGAMPSRPLWNSPILAMLFLISALSTGVATIILARVFFKEKFTDSTTEHRYHETGYMLTTADLLLIGFEILVIFLFIMFAHLTIGNLKYAMAIILPGGEMAGMFWFWVVIIGLVIPGVLEMVYVLPKMIYRSEFRVPRISEAVISIAVLAGGFMLRYVIVVAGQITGPMGI